MKYYKVNDTTYEVTSDTIGNLTAYDNKTFTWEAGRQLKTYIDTKGTPETTDDTNISYKYNDSGIRTEKTINGVTTEYFLSGDKVIRETKCNRHYLVYL